MLSDGYHMTCSLFDVVMLVENMPEVGFLAGSRGAVVDVYSQMKVVRFSYVMSKGAQLYN